MEQAVGATHDGDHVVAIGHRVVHGGRRFTQPVVVDDVVLESLRVLSPLAPLHNPANVEGIVRAQEAFPGLPHVAVFDTGFHGTLPPAAYTYAVPDSWRETSPPGQMLSCRMRLAPPISETSPTATV